MTVEVERKTSKLGGLGQVTTRRVAEFRSINERPTPYLTIGHTRPELVILHREPPLDPEESLLPSLTTFAWVRSEDVVEVHDSDLRTITNVRTFVGDEINKANLVDDEGKTRLIWRETRPGDYPQVPEGQEMSPIQLDFNLR